jgi:hypothetical protein
MHRSRHGICKSSRRGNSGKVASERGKLVQESTSSIGGGSYDARHEQVWRPARLVAPSVGARVLHASEAKRGFVWLAKTKKVQRLRRCELSVWMWFADVTRGSEIHQRKTFSSQRTSRLIGAAACLGISKYQSIDLYVALIDIDTDCPSVHLLIKSDLLQLFLAILNFGVIPCNICRRRH